MKFSIATASVLALACLSSAVKAADSYSSAIDEFCGGLTVAAPTDATIVVAGNNATVTVNRVPNNHEKIISGLDLYTVDSNSKPVYVKNVWAGSYSLQTSASISDQIPADTAAGLYLYRVWVSNKIDGGRGPDCIKLSNTFKVTTGAHTNAAGFTSYAQSLDDVNYFKPEFAKGCFGLTVQSPQEGSTQQLGSHVSITLNRDSVSLTGSLTKVEIYKAVEGSDEYVDTIWSGDELLTNAFLIKDHLKIPSEKFDANAYYYYKLDVTSQVKGETCSFQSGAFKVAA